MVMCQLIYDLTTYFDFCPESNLACLNAKAFICLYMGMVVTLWTNVVVSIVYYSTFVYFEVNIIEEKFKIFFSSFHLLGLLFGILDVIAFYNWSDFTIKVIIYIYNSLRLLSIAYNFLIICLIYYKIRNYEKNNPIFELTRRLVFYPIVQIITYASVSWYSFKYPSDNNDDDNASTARYKNYYYYYYYYYHYYGNFS